MDLFLSFIINNIETNIINDPIIKNKDKKSLKINIPAIIENGT